MIYLPDTDIINYAIKGIAPVEARFQQAVAMKADFVLRPVVHFQVTRYIKLKGAERSKRLYTNLTKNWLRIELLDSDWDAAADLWADRHRTGQPIQDADLLIAITARKANAVLVTNNTRHFEGLGLTLENWTL